MTSLIDLQRTVLPFIESCRLQEGAGHYRYSTAVSKKTLYSSAYAAMTKSLLGSLSLMDDGEKEAWAEYLNSHQDNDGLFRDPVIYGEGLYENDPLWCGRTHLTCHVITALECLGYVAAKPVSFLDEYKDLDKLGKWLSGLDFNERVDFTGNEIMNIGTLLQYSRDFHSDDKAGKAASFILDWLSKNHTNKESGIWGNLDISNPIQRSKSVQAAYHWWPLFFYDKHPVPYAEPAIDTVLQTQNPIGGFGWGIHNSKEPYLSSACEDIDSIDPLVRLSTLTQYRSIEIKNTLFKAKNHIMSNQMTDGGFVFIRDQEFMYGHPQLYGAADKGAMFPTWFRTLSISYLDTYLCKMENIPTPYCFVNAPGYQFWKEQG